jgi:hypothetical protein
MSAALETVITARRHAMASFHIIFDFNYYKLYAENNCTGFFTGL